MNKITKSEYEARKRKINRITKRVMNEEIIYIQEAIGTNGYYAMYQNGDYKFLTKEELENLNNKESDE